MSDCRTEWTKRWAPTHKYVAICVSILSAQQFSSFHPKWRKIKICGAYYKIMLLFFDNFPFLMTFGFSYKRRVSSGELVYRNVAPVDSYVYCEVSIICEDILEVLNIKNTKGKWLRCEVMAMLIALAVVSIFYSPWGHKESAMT